MDETLRMLRRTADALAGNVPWEQALGDQTAPVAVELVLHDGTVLTGSYDLVLRILDTGSIRSGPTQRANRIIINPGQVAECRRMRPMSRPMPRPAPR